MFDRAFAVSSGNRSRHAAIKAIGQFAYGDRITAVQKLPRVPAERAFLGYAFLAVLCGNGFHAERVAKWLDATLAAWIAGLALLKRHCLQR